MQHSKLIAGLIGPVIAAMGIALLINRDLFPALASQIAHDQGLIFLSGILSLLAGLAIVRVHNIWRGWRAILTVLGWLAILGGLARMLFTQLAAPIAETFAANTAALMIAGLALLALGAFLSYKAYGSDT